MEELKTNLELIKKLERHTGFILDLLHNAKSAESLNRLRAEFCQVFAHLRLIPDEARSAYISRSQIMQSMDSWCNLEHIDEKSAWE